MPNPIPMRPCGFAKLKFATGESIIVEIMSLPWQEDSNDDTDTVWIMVRLIPGDACSLCEIDCSQLGVLD